MSPTTARVIPLKRSSRTADRVTRSQTTSRSRANSAVSTSSSTSADPVRIATARRAVNVIRSRPLRRSITSGSNLSPITRPHVNEVEEATEIDTPSTPENVQSNVPIVDLITPQPPTPLSRAVRRPVEVDLTCDLDDEVFVVLEDIANPSHRTNPSSLPILLGASPPRSRALRGNILSTLGLRRQGRPTVSADLEMYQAITTGVSTPTTISPPAPPAPKQDTSNGIYCPICLDTLSQVKDANHQMHSTTCGHLFCGPCIKRVIEATHQCPTCRKRLDVRKIHPIFI